MRYYTDNFLDDDSFKKLNERMIYMFGEIKGKVSSNPFTATRFFTRIDNNDYSNSESLLKMNVSFFSNQIKTFLENSLNFKNAEPLDVWIQYQAQKQKVGKHFDVISLRKKKPTQCFNTFLYSHDKWEEDWGGELCFHGEKILPKANRLIIYSRDEEHWVNPIKHNINGYHRMFFGISWSTDNDF